MEGCISDNWMRGSNSYLKRTRLVAPSKKVTITISPTAPVHPLEVSMWKCQYRWHPLSDLQPALRLPVSWDSQRLVFFLCTGSLLAALCQYPLIKPVTSSLTVTLKNQTKVTLCFKSKRSTSTLFVYFPLNRWPFSLTGSSFYLSGGKLQPNESNWKLPLSFSSEKTGPERSGTGSGSPPRGARRFSSPNEVN